MRWFVAGCVFVWVGWCVWMEGGPGVFKRCSVLRPSGAVQPVINPNVWSAFGPLCLLFTYFNVSKSIRCDFVQRYIVSEIIQNSTICKAPACFANHLDL